MKILRQVEIVIFMAFFFAELIPSFAQYEMYGRPKRTKRAFSNINKSFININKSFININKSFININKSFININKYLIILRSIY